MYLDEEDILSPEDERMIGNIIYQVAKNEKEDKIDSVSKESIKKLNNLFIRLKKMLEDERRTEKSKNNLSYYNSEKGWSDFLYQLKDQKDYIELFNICSEILDIIRYDDPSQEIELTVFSVFDDGRINLYVGKETSFTTSIGKEDYKYNGEKKTRDILQFQIKDAKDKLMQFSRDSLFAKHFSNFQNKAEEIRIKSNLTDKSFNQGHIIEAYQRHLYYQHGLTELSMDTISNIKLDRLTKKIVAINLYYSMNSDAWFAGGDVGKFQIKGNNRKIGTIMSIQAVASKLLEIYNNRMNFDEKTFKKLFTQKDYKDMTKNDPENLGKRKLNQMYEILGSKNKGKNDNIDIQINLTS